MEKKGILSHLAKPKPKQGRRTVRRFADQLNKININVFRKADKAISQSPGLYTEGVQSHFQDAFEKYVSVNLTEDFHKFAVQVKGMITSLPLLLFHKEDIWNKIIEHIKKPDSLAVEVLLDLLTCLSRDLLDEFYPFFLPSLKVVVDLIDIKSSARIEQCFTCIAYFFKFLRKQIVEDIDKLFFEYYYIIISHPKEFIRQFSAESFSFLLRNLKREKIDEFIHSIFTFQERLINQEEGIKQVNILLFSDGLVNVLFEVIKGTSYGFHSKMPNYFSALLRTFEKNSSPWSFSVLFGLIKKMCLHTNEENCIEFYMVFLKFMNHLLTKVPSRTEIETKSIQESSKLKKRKKTSLAIEEGTDNPRLINNIENSIEVLDFLLNFKNGKFWSNNKKIIDQVFLIQSKLILVISWHEFRLFSVIVSIVSSSFRKIQESQFCDDIIDNQLPEYLKVLFDKKTLISAENIKIICLFIRESMELTIAFGRFILSYFVMLCNEYINDYFSIIMQLFLDIIDNSSWNRASSPHIVRISHQNRFSMLPKNSEESTFINYLFDKKLAIFSKIGTSDDNTISLHDSISLDEIWSILKVLQHVELNYTLRLITLLEIFEILQIRSLEPSLRSPDEFLCLSENFSCLYKLYHTYDSQELDNCWNYAWKLIQIEPSNAFILEAVLGYIEILEKLSKPILKKLKTQEIYSKLEEILVFNLSSCCQSLRIVTYKLFILLDPEQKDAENSILAKFLAVEEVPKQSLEARACTHILSAFEGTFRFISSSQVSLVTHCLIGCLQIKYSPMWPIIIKLFSILVEEHFDDVFTILFHFYEKIFDVLIIQSNQCGKKQTNRHILAAKLHKPAGDGITAQNPETIKTNLQQNMESFNEDPLQENFINIVNSSEIRLGFQHKSTDIYTLHNYIWKTFCLFPLQMEKVASKITPFFISFIQLQFAPVEWKTLTPSDLFHNFQFDFKSSINEKDIDKNKNLPQKQLQPVLIDFLNLFGLFKNPKKLKYTEILKNIYEILICYGDSKVQLCCLKCLFTWKFDYLKPYRENLERIADDKTTREEITLFNITIENETIKKQHRIEFSKLLIKILYSKLISVNKRSKIHRHTILAYLGGLEIDEMEPLFNLLLQPFNRFFETLKNNNNKQVINENNNDMTDDDDDKNSQFYIDNPLYQILQTNSPLHYRVQKISLSKKSKFLVLMQDILRQFGKRIEVYLSPLIQILVGFILYEFTQTTSNANTRNNSFKRLSTMIQNYPNYPFANYFKEPLYENLYIYLEKLALSPKLETPVLNFFVSMSSSPYLILELHKTSCLSLLIDIISPQCSIKVLGSILQIIENLVDVQNMIDEKNLNQQIVIDYVDKIIEKLDNLGLQASNQNILVERVLNLLAYLSKYASNSEQADHLISALLVYLSPQYHYVSFQRKEKIFEIINSLLRITQIPEEIIEQTSFQFLSLNETESRKKLLQLTKNIADDNILPNFSFINSIIMKLNSFSSTIVGQYDYESRLKGFKEFKVYLNEIINSYDEKLIYPPVYYYPIIYNCLHFIKDSDISIRGNAEETIQILLKFISLKIEKIKENKQKLHHMKQQQLIQQYQKIVTNMIFPFIKKNIKKSDRDVKLLNESLKLMHYLVEYFPVLYNDLQYIVRPEWSFFIQFSSTSINEQSKAIVQLKRFVAQKLNSIPFSYSTNSNILIPLLFNKILNPKTPLLLMDEIMTTLSNICYHLNWKRYYQFLSYFISTASSVTINQQKNIIRLCCYVLDSFHYLSTSKDDQIMEVQSEEGEEDDDDNDDFENDNEEIKSSDPMEVEKDENEEEDEEDDDDDDENKNVKKDDDDNKESQNQMKKEEKTTKKALTEEEKIERLIRSNNENQIFSTSDIHIMGSLTKQIIPNLLNLIQTDKSLISTNIHICQAVVKVLNILPEKLQNREIPKLLKKMIINLRSRDQKIRDETRDTLLKVLQTLGSKHFHLVIRELSTSLVKGYQLHILGFTIHYLLHHLHKSNKIQQNDLNNCIKQLSIVFMDDIIGEAAQKKEVKQIKASMKEAKSIKSFESFEIVSETIGFSNYIQELIHPVYSVLITSNSSKTIKKMNEILHKISIGLTKNKFIQYDQLLIFLHSIISDNLQSFSDLEEKEKLNVLSQQQKITGRLEAVQSDYDKVRIISGPRALANQRKSAMEYQINLHILAEFALTLFHSTLKRNRYNTKDEKQISMLDPFVELLIQKGLYSSNEKSIILSLKCLQCLIKAPLPSLERLLESLNIRLFELIQKTSSKSELMNILFKSIIILLRDCSPAPGRKYSISLTDDQIKFLLSITSNQFDNQNFKNSNLIFSLLKTITEQKIVLPEVYDIMNSVSQFIVSASDLNIRQNCLHIFLKFLLYYPLGELRLQQHIDFILKNLSYYSPDGRQSVLELLNQIIMKFPDDHINNQAEYFYFSLVLCLVNDEISICREMAGNVIKSLISKVNKSKFDSIFTLTKKWIHDDNNLLLQRAASQLFGLFIETANNNNNDLQLLNHCNLIEILSSQLHDDDTIDHLNLDDEDEEIISLAPQRWHVVYYSLIAIEKYIRYNSNILKSKNEQNVLFLCLFKVISLMLHSHYWIRILTGRILGLCFASLKDPKDLKGVKNLPITEFFYLPGLSRFISRRLCLQLKNEHLTPTDGQQIVRNLLFLTVALFKNDNLHKQADLSLSKENEQLLNTSSSSHGNDDKNMDDGSDDENEDVDKVKKKHQIVHWIFRLLSFTARRLSNQAQTVSSFLSFLKNS